MSYLKIDEDEEKRIKAGATSDVAVTTFTIHPEHLRVFTYTVFYAMVISAILFFNFFVTGVDLTDTPLVRMFGYNNICIYWDYSPSRELTAMIYPLVEYPLIGYILLNFAQSHSLYHEGTAPRWYYLLSATFLPLQIILAAWFRMIFVVVAFEDVVGHTLGFQGLQLCLVLVSVQNALYWVVAEHTLPCASRATTLIIMWGYVAVLAIITFVKLTIVLSLFAGSPVIDPTTPFGASVSSLFDRFWLLFAAVIPFFVALLQSRVEKGLEITLRLK